ncbi:MAG: thioredoxin domain-containing protein [Synechococcales bacterium]|nr:thioredoxin domain-containing protein [Synechococcales bacterium]
MPSLINDQKFTQEVLNSDAPVLVHFWAPWCGLCRLIEPALHHVLQESGSSLKLVGINADENLRLASSYHITNLPTVLLFQGGKVLDRIDTIPSQRDQLPNIFRDLLRHTRSYSL